MGGGDRRCCSALDGDSWAFSVGASVFEAPVEDGEGRGAHQGDN